MPYSTVTGTQGLESEVLCFLECFSADALPVNWSCVLLSVLLFVKADGGEKPTLWNTFLSFPTRHPSWLFPRSGGSAGASKTKTFTSHVSDFALSYLQQN